MNQKKRTPLISKMKKEDRAPLVYQRLDKLFPNAHCELNHETPFQLLIATILSAQCTDVRVNMVTPQLFKSFPDAEKLSKAPQEKIEEIIKSTGFFRAKAKNIIGCAHALIENFNGEIPKNIEDLSSLPGVGRKTANVVLGNAFNINAGVVVDTHVKRISKLLGLTRHEQPEKVEIDLMELFPQSKWTQLSHLFIFLGRRICIARRPQCELCVLKDICPSAKLVNPKNA
jgi:endonuclease III